jgi:phage/plasmid primase-like uncharacterized protein
LGCGYAVSLADGEDGQLLLHCFGGCEFAEIMPALVEFGLFDGDDEYQQHGEEDHRRVVYAHQRDDAERIAHARQIYDAASWDQRIAVYLRGRGIHLISPLLRFSETAPHRLGTHLPAILAPVVDINGKQTGTHLTYLRHDGGLKVNLPKEYQRECRGVIRGGSIRLAPHDPDTELVVGEGVESTLSAMQLFGRVGWSAVYAGGLKTLELPPAVRSIIIAADNDVSGAGQCNALAAYDRWRLEGRQVSIKTPPDIGTDFNDLLLDRGRDE